MHYLITDHQLKQHANGWNVAALNANGTLEQYTGWLVIWLVGLFLLLPLGA
jgi:hypothetical protein